MRREIIKKITQASLLVIGIAFIGECAVTRVVKPKQHVRHRSAVRLRSTVLLQSTTKAGSRLVNTARRYLGIPYRYGGKKPGAGFDCSGLTGYVYRKNGYRIPAGARNQYRAMRSVRYPRPGDLVFFNISGSGISHVGIYVGGYRFIHAPRTGKTVEYADMRKRYWKRRYAGSRSIF